MKSNVRQAAGGLVLAGTTGVLILAAFMIEDMGFVIWFGLVPLLIALFRLCPTRSFAFALCLVSLEIGVGYPLCSLCPHVWMYSLALLLPISCAYIVSLLWLVIRKNPDLLLIPVSASAAAATDLLLSFAPFSTLLSPAATQTAYPVLMGPASLIGFPFVTFLIAASNCVLSALILETLSGTRRFRTTLAWGVLIAASIGVSNLPRNEGPVLRIAALEAKHSHSDVADASRRMLVSIGYHEILSMAEGSDLIVYPEAFISYDFSSDKSRFEKCANRVGIPLIVGCYSMCMNIAAPVFPKTGFAEAYEKHYPARIVGEDCLPGEAEPVYDAKWGRFGILICYDMYFEEIARRLARRGAKLIAAPTNSVTPEIARLVGLRVARLRAVENHVAVAVSDLSGATAIVSPRGKTMAQSSGKAGMIIADVPLGSGCTFYNHAGYLLRWLFIPAFLVSLIWGCFARGKGT